MGNEEQRPSVSVTAGIGTLSVRSSNRHGTRGTSTQQAFPVEAVREPSTCSRSSAGLLFPLRAGVASREPSPAANATRSHPDLQPSR
ncbi:MAG: hypothetical protein ACJ8CB_34955 [Ktedonobacteraceae bacterium]